MADYTSDSYRAIDKLLWNDRLSDAERLEQMRPILEKNPGMVLEQDARGNTLLHRAAFSDSSLEYCRVLLEVDPTHESLQLRNVRGKLPFREACIAGNLETARYLLVLHPDSTNLINIYGCNCLHLLFCNYSLPG